MILKVDAIHTAGVLKPTRDLPLRENQRVRLIVQPIEEPEQNRTAAIARLKAGIWCVTSSECGLDGRMFQVPLGRPLVRVAHAAQHRFA